MGTLSLKELKVRVTTFEAVDVPEFGAGMTVNVRGLTVTARQTLGIIMREMGVAALENGVVVIPPSPAAVAEFQAVNAALCSYDDDDNLVFGTNPMEAINFVRSLPGQYSGAIARISTVATRLTNGAGSEQAAVEDAEKN
jgi:hypothetical protein